MLPEALGDQLPKIKVNVSVYFILLFPCEKSVERILGMELRHLKFNLGLTTGLKVYTICLIHCSSLKGINTK